MFKFWKKKSVTLLTFVPTEPFKIYSIETAQSNLREVQKQKEKECLNLLINEFNRVVHLSTKKGWPFIDFGMLNIYPTANNEFMNMLKEGGYTPKVTISRRSYQELYEYSITIPLAMP